MFRNAAIVGAGAALGAAARLCATLMAGNAPGLWVLLTVNVLGCVLMGAWKPGLFLGKGVLGGYTSFSAFTLVLMQAPPATALAYLAATVFGCVGGWLLGHALSPGRITATRAAS